jgi:hypothetical protein
MLLKVDFMFVRIGQRPVLLEVYKEQLAIKLRGDILCACVRARVCARAYVCAYMYCYACLQATSSVHYTTSCKHSLVLLRMGEIIARNMLS